MNERQLKNRMRQFLLPLSFVEGKWKGKLLTYHEHDGKKCRHRWKTFFFAGCQIFTEGAEAVTLAVGMQQGFGNQEFVVHCSLWCIYFASEDWGHRALLSLIQKMRQSDYHYTRRVIHLLLCATRFDCSNLFHADSRSLWVDLCFLCRKILD